MYIFIMHSVSLTPDLPKWNCQGWHNTGFCTFSPSWLKSFCTFGMASDFAENWGFPPAPFLSYILRRQPGKEHNIPRLWLLTFNSEGGMQAAKVPSASVVCSCYYLRRSYTGQWLMIVISSIWESHVMANNDEVKLCHIVNWGHKFHLQTQFWPWRLFGGCGGLGGCQRGQYHISNMHMDK